MFSIKYYTFFCICQKNIVPLRAAKYNGVPNGRQQSASGGESVAYGESSYDRCIGKRTEP